MKLDVHCSYPAQRPRSAFHRLPGVCQPPSPPPPPRVDPYAVFHPSLARRLSRLLRRHRPLRTCSCRFQSPRHTTRSRVGTPSFVQSTRAQIRESSFDIPQRAALTGCRGRRLPYTPAEIASNGHTNGYPAYAAHKGLPPDPRPSRKLPSTSRPGTASSAVTDVPSISMPQPDIDSDWRPSSGYSNGNVSRNPSGRSAIRSPYENGYDDPPPRSPSSLDDMYASPSSDYANGSTLSDTLRSGYANDHTLRPSPSQNAMTPTPPSLYANSMCA